MRVNPSSYGFTLIELLVVLVIVGIILSIATLSIGVLGRDNSIEAQARRLEAVISQVREESELQGRDLGLFVERDGYVFRRYDYPSQSWQDVVDDSLLSYRELPPGLQTRLWLDGREIILKTHVENAALSRQTSSFASSSTASGASSISSYGSSSVSSKDAKKDPLAPQVYLLSSGDISPFELRIEREGNDFSWHLVAKADNTVTAEITNAAK